MTVFAALVIAVLLVFDARTIMRNHWEWHDWFTAVVVTWAWLIVALFLLDMAG